MHIQISGPSARAHGNPANRQPIAAGRGGSQAKAGQLQIAQPEHVGRGAARGAGLGAGLGRGRGRASSGGGARGAGVDSGRGNAAGGAGNGAGLGSGRGSASSGGIGCAAGGGRGIGSVNLSDLHGRPLGQPLVEPLIAVTAKPSGQVFNPGTPNAFQSIPVEMRTQSGGAVSANLHTHDQIWRDTARMTGTPYPPEPAGNHVAAQPPASGGLYLRAGHPGYFDGQAPQHNLPNNYTGFGPGSIRLAQGPETASGVGHQEPIPPAVPGTTPSENAGLFSAAVHEASDLIMPRTWTGTRAHVSSPPGSLPSTTPRTSTISRRTSTTQQ